METWKEVAVVYSRNYAGIYLDKLGKTIKNVVGNTVVLA
jgi:hypothetical protein